MTIPPIAPDPGELPFLTPRQRELYDALVDLDPSWKLGRMYLGSVLVRQQRGNPDAIALSAHGVRELMEKLPKHLDVPMAHRLTSRMGGVVERWKRMATAQADQRDKARAKFCKEAEKLVRWYIEQNAERPKRAGMVMDQLDQRKASLPQPIKQPH